MPAAFYFDLASPLAYLAAERVLHVLPGPAEWKPVLAAELVGAERFDAYRCEQEREVFRQNVELRARELGLQPLRWPEPFPFDSALAMRAATYAKSIGRTVPFVQAAFRQVFAGGRNLQQLDNVLIAAAACEMHPAAVTKGVALSSVNDQLAEATRHARRENIKDVPAIVVDGHVHEGERAVELAAEQMLAAASA
ncbi:MAG TPA: DsbA family protein [Solirubrobacteraceae bacterium]|nr:DsbA family protein [Solirubrobacteraceae bacterium]